MLRNGISESEKAKYLFLALTKACPKGQIAQLDTAFCKVRERHHGIIPSHRIRFGLPPVGIAARGSRQVPSPQGAPSKRLSRVSRKTGDQNASSV
ncbi:MAG: hypothetical protein JWM03_178 [Rhodocyclales bacterium]|nr:hypothetical protein [Rhodocyclales bacterium]